MRPVRAALTTKKSSRSHSFECPRLSLCLFWFELLFAQFSDVQSFNVFVRSSSCCPERASSLVEASLVVGHYAYFSQSCYNNCQYNSKYHHNSYPFFFLRLNNLLYSKVICHFVSYSHRFVLHVYPIVTNLYIPSCKITFKSSLSVFFWCKDNNCLCTCTTIKRKNFIKPE